MIVTINKIIEKLNEVDVSNLGLIYSYVSKFTPEAEKKREQTINFNDFVQPTPRGNNADEYIRKLRDE